MDWLRNIATGIKNLIAFTPIIWNDRDWDHAFLLELLEFKLRRMAKFIGERGQHLDANVDAARIAEAADICRRLRTDDYYKLLWRAFFDKYPLRFTDYQIERMGEDERAQFSALRERHDAAERADLERLGELFTKHLLGWWD